MCIGANNQQPPQQTAAACPRSTRLQLDKGAFGQRGAAQGHHVALLQQQVLHHLAGGEGENSVFYCVVFVAVD